MTPVEPARGNRVVIVDDEQLAREGLRDAIVRAALPSIEIAALCENGIVALEAIRRLEPEILLLDVVMPVLDGFAMLEQLEPESTPPAVIIVTAYDEYAIRAFDAAAIDFLVKPASDERVHAALDRAVRRVAESRAARGARVAASRRVASRRSSRHSGTRTNADRSRRRDRMDRGRHVLRASSLGRTGSLAA